MIVLPAQDLDAKARFYQEGEVVFCQDVLNLANIVLQGVFAHEDDVRKLVVALVVIRHKQSVEQEADAVIRVGQIGFAVAAFTG